jgi:hypothetical protein
MPIAGSIDTEVVSDIAAFPGFLQSRQVTQHYSMASSSLISPEVIVGIAIGLPSLLMTLISLWLAYLTYTHTRAPRRRLTQDAVPLLPIHHETAAQPHHPNAELLARVLPLLLAPPTASRY